MASVVLIHGTGVREPAYTSFLQRVRSSVTKLAPNTSVHPCYWGGVHGTSFRHGGKSIPDYDTSRSLGEVDPDDEAALRWDLLYQDPLFELRLLAGQDGTSPKLGGDDSAADELVAQVERLEATGALAQKLQDTGLAEEFAQACEFVGSSDVFRAAMAAAGEDIAEHRAAVARAIVANAIRAADAELMSDDKFDGYGVLPVWTVAGPTRDEIVALVMDELGGAEYGIFAWVGHQVVGLASWYGTRKFRRQRGAISDAASPAAADILFYQTRGGDIRNFIANAVRAAPPPVTLIAHSLGGIASVDLLVMQPVPEVTLLVTVGSQAPYLYEVDALTSLRWNETLPKHFPRWLNIYDPRDFLSYLAAPLFPAATKGIRDFEVDNRESFPRAHSAYWSNPAVWKAIGEEAQWT
jgi:hypothetical protein